LRILYVTDGIAPYVVGGMQAVARRHIESLADAGHDVVLLAPDFDGSDEPQPWTVVRRPWPRRSFLHRLSPWRYVADLKRFSRAVTAVADTVDPDVVYAEGPLVSDYLKRAPGRRAPVIFHPHGLEMFQPKGSFVADIKSWPLRGITRDHVRHADIIVSQSARGAIHRILAERLGAVRERIFVLPNAISASQPVATSPKSPQGGRFLFVGRDEPRKGLPLLIKAFTGLEDATLDIVGSRPAASLPAGVTSHGEVRDKARVAGFYRAADFVVVPSFAEGMPTVILEAFAAGVPVIATDVGASADLVRDGETGFLIRPGDAAALRKAMEEALGLAPDAYRAMSARCIDLVRREYYAGAVERRLLDLFDGVLSADLRTR
jgi:glycosyltransferase involved in cell wall biosynthesis